MAQKFRFFEPHAGHTPPLNRWWWDCFRGRGLMGSRLLPKPLLMSYSLFVFRFSLLFCFCAVSYRLSWPSRQLVSAHKYTVGLSRRIVTEGWLLHAKLRSHQCNTSSLRGEKKNKIVQVTERHICSRKLPVKRNKTWNFIASWRPSFNKLGMVIEYNFCTCKCIRIQYMVSPPGALKI